MALIQEIKDGVALSDKAKKASGGTTTGKGAEKTNSGSKDLFLKLLVAEMQYQDPMEPTSNTEYVKEMSTLSQVESLQNMEKSITNTSIQNYVGKYVEVKDEDGKAVDGIVDYVTEVDGEKMISIDGKQYKASQVTSVYDSTYAENNYTLQTFAELYSKLPALDRVTAADEKDIVKAVDLYNSMSDDLRSSIKQENRDNLTALYNRVEQIIEAQRKAAEEAAGTTEGEPSAEVDEEKAAEAVAGASGTEETGESEGEETTDENTSEKIEENG